MPLIGRGSSQERNSWNSRDREHFPAETSAVILDRGIRDGDGSG